MWIILLLWIITIGLTAEVREKTKEREREKQGCKSTLGLSPASDEWGKKEEGRPLNSTTIHQSMIISGTMLAAV